MPGIEWGVVSVTLAGETESGDSHVVKEFPDGVLVAAVDGLGHGNEAAAAAKIATDTLERHAQEPVISLVRICHLELQRSRGVVMSLASFNTRDNRMEWMGVGNIEGVLFRGQQSGAQIPGDCSRERVLIRGGVVGFQLPPMRASVLPVAPGDTLIFATDGIKNGFEQNVSLNLRPQEIADRIGAQYYKGTDDGLVLVARYLGGGLGRNSA